jgi:hypothetical protein
MTTPPLRTSSTANNLDDAKAAAARYFILFILQPCGGRHYYVRWQRRINSIRLPWNRKEERGVQLQKLKMKVDLSQVSRQVEGGLASSRQEKPLLGCHTAANFRSPRGLGVAKAPSDARKPTGLRSRVKVSKNDKAPSVVQRRERAHQTLLKMLKPRNLQRRRMKPLAPPPLLLHRHNKNVLQKGPETPDSLDTRPEKVKAGRTPLNALHKSKNLQVICERFASKHDHNKKNSLLEPISPRLGANTVSSKQSRLDLHYFIHKQSSTHHLNNGQSAASELLPSRTTDPADSGQQLAFSTFCSRLETAGANLPPRTACLSVNASHSELASSLTSEPIARHLHTLQRLITPRPIHQFNKSKDHKVIKAHTHRPILSAAAFY